MVGGKIMNDKINERNTGRLTPSGFKRMMSKGRGKKPVGDTAYKYAYEILLERIGVFEEDFQTKEMRWGEEHEEQAILAIENKIDRAVIPGKHIVAPPPYNYIGGTPDGIIDNEIVVEVKCPFTPTNHYKNYKTGAQLYEDYMYQVQGYMFITGLEKALFVSYDPRFKPDMRLVTISVNRDEDMINNLLERAELINNFIEKELKN